MDRYIEYLWHTLYNGSVKMYEIRKDLYPEEPFYDEYDVFVYQWEQDEEHQGKKPWE